MKLLPLNFLTYDLIPLEKHLNLIEKFQASVFLLNGQHP